MDAVTEIPVEAARRVVVAQRLVIWPFKYIIRTLMFYTKYQMHLCRKLACRGITIH